MPIDRPSVRHRLPPPRKTPPGARSARRLSGGPQKTLGDRKVEPPWQARFRWRQTTASITFSVRHAECEQSIRLPSGYRPTMEGNHGTTNISRFSPGSPARHAWQLESARADRHRLQAARLHRPDAGRQRGFPPLPGGQRETRCRGRGHPPVCTGTDRVDLYPGDRHIVRGDPRSSKRL